MEINGKKYVALVPTAKKIENEELWNKTRDAIRSITKNSDDQDEK